VPEVRLKCSGTESAGEYTFFFFHGKENKNHELDTGLFLHKGIISSIEFLCDGMSYIILRGSLCCYIILNIHASTMDKIHAVKDSFYECV
jgi:hypothetical protein